MRSMRSSGVEDVAEGEHPGVVDQDVDGKPVGLRAAEQLAGGPDAGQVAHHDADVALREPFGKFSADRFEVLSVVADQHEVVPQCGEPPGITAPDTRPGTADQRPGGSLRDLAAPHPVSFLSVVHRFHQGRRLSSSTILRGRSGQCLQHFMSTEYIRAMQ